jgi:copper chaperone CopZ
VTQVDVDFDAKTAKLTAASDTVDRAACEAALQGVGYGVSSFEEIAAK